ncbi:Cation/calcium exchanger 3 [Dichanthelium oligosanthes]|uniref:Cation/calcium exchanger 3 n=1 Tax=Dichanthelium oligosanthes TaxID=888268 RepID=A0A1E5VJB8_9POAL|nr:Cation/calcium exchanger 3 [Dichanthelium oligosanthes]
MARRALLPARRHRGGVFLLQRQGPLAAARAVTTDPSAPPTRFLSVWLAAGFAVSVAWAYVVANEVLALLVSAGIVLSLDTATLALTVLAWGNSLGDLITNVAMASRGGPGGAQVAVSGCYGGPVFNVLVHLGMSMLLSCWAGYPRPLEIPREPGLYRTMGFVVGGLLWAVVVLPRRGMKVGSTLGFGLLVIYLGFLCINISQLESQL